MLPWRLPIQLRTAHTTLNRLLHPHKPNLSVPPISFFQARRTMATAAMAKRLEGKTIVITGASSGIGKSTAIEFARTSPKNLKLILTARRIDALKQIAEEIRQEAGDGVKVLPVKMDVSVPEEVNSFVGNLPEEFKDIDVLVNNAYAPFHPLYPPPSID